MTFGGGWWYEYCMSSHNACLTADYGSNFFWQGLIDVGATTNDPSIVASRIMIKPQLLYL